MKYAIISDIHSNIEAFDKVLHDMGVVDGIFCLGDIIGYGASPNECIKRIREIKAKSIIGNHDLAVIKKLDLKLFNVEARVAIQWTANKLTKSNIRYLESLKEIYFLQNNIFMVHGSPEDNRWNYVDNHLTAATIFKNYTFNIIFLGHSHIAGCFVFEKEKVNYIDLSFGGHILFSKNNRYIVNCGSVGQPRDGNPKTSYGIYDDKAKKVIIKRIKYPILLAQNKLLDAGLPQNLAYRLKIGR